MESNSRTKSKPIDNDPAPNEGLSLSSRVAFLLRNQIVRGQFSPGQKLPNEEDLAAKFRVSRVTIRTALARLEAQKLIIKKRPLGTFVSESIPCRKQNIVSGGVHDIVRTAETFEVKCLGIHRVSLKDTRFPNELGEFLKSSRDSEIGWIQRVRFLKGVPIYYLENFMPFHLAQKMSFDELSHKPVLRVLKEKAGLQIGRGEMFIEAIPAEDDVASMLQIPIFEPLILAQVYYWWPDGEPLQTANLYMKPEFFKYRVDLDAKGLENI